MITIGFAFNFLSAQAPTPQLNELLTSTYENVERNVSMKELKDYHELEELTVAPKLQSNEMDVTKHLLLQTQQKTSARSYIEVKILFDVTAQGSMSNIVFLNELPPKLKEDAIKLLKGLPSWSPGKIGNKSVTTKNCKLNFFMDLTAFEDVYLFNASDQKSIEKNPDVPAQFVGGAGKMIEFIDKNLVYPMESFENNVAGIVKVALTLDTQGKISDVKILKGLDEACNAEAVRLFFSMPNWVPALKDNVRVPSEAIQYLLFKL
jgi:hypothetical protein